MTEPVAMLSNGMKTLALQLDAERLEPDPFRTDWSKDRDAVEDVVETLERDVLAHLDAAMAALFDNQDAATKGREQVAGMTGEVAVLLQLSGDADRARKWFDRAISLAPETSSVREELSAGRSDRDGFATLVYARWLAAHRRWDHADAVYKRAARQAKEASIRSAAKKELNGSRPVFAAPTLARLNGFGTGIYGRRDERSDGSYITTLCISALFIPVFPLKAYRVVSHGGGRYGFMTREPLSSFARLMRWLVLAAAVFGIGGASLNSWWQSPDHQASRAIAAARREEQQHHAARALQLYEAALEQYAARADGDTLAPASLAVVRLSTASLHEPISLADTDQASRIVVRFEHLPSTVRTDDPASLLVSTLLRWQTQLGDSTPEQCEGSLRLVSLATRVAPMARRSSVESRARAIHVRLGAMLARDWPAEALHHFVASAPDAAAVDAATPAVRALISSPSLASESATDLQAWVGAAQNFANPSLESLVHDAQSALNDAQAMNGDAARTAALDHRDVAALNATLERYPHDQDTIAALAQTRREAGDPAAALAMLRALGGPGMMTAHTQLAFAGAMVDNGQLPEADALLDHVVSARLPAFQSAQHEYQTALRGFREQIRSDLEQGRAPEELSDQHFSNRDEQREAVMRWINGQMDHNPDLTRLRHAYEQHASLVPAALIAATVKLRRASGASGTTREQLLTGAERLFLAIREEADDVPQFHLGLGQVYHRLGRAADGDRELQTLLDAHNPEQTLQVAHVYRELGLTARARQIAQGVYDAGQSPSNGDAAMLMSLLADTIADRELWLRRAPTDIPSVRIGLREIEAAHLEMAHNYTGADRAFAEVAAYWTEQGAHSPAAANNAALAEHERFRCTGDRSRLHAAVEGLETALRLAPDNTIVLSNIGTALRAESVNTILERAVRTSVLRLSSSTADSVLAGLVWNRTEPALADALRTDPGIRRQIELARQGEVLAPERSDGYESELTHYAMLEDVAALRDLEARLLRGPQIDTSAAADGRRRYLTGEFDGQSREAADGEVAHSDDALSAAQRTGHGPTLAAAHMVRGMALFRRAQITDSIADADASIEETRAADRLWPELNARWSLPHRLLLSAVLHTIADSPALAAAYRRDRRSYSTEVILYRWATTDAAAAAPVLQTLRSNPLIVEALSIALAGAAVRPSASQWMLGRVFGDDALVHAADGFRSDERERLALSIGLRLDPDSPELRALDALMTTRP